MASWASKLLILSLNSLFFFIASLLPFVNNETANVAAPAAIAKGPKGVPANNTPKLPRRPALLVAEPPSLPRADTPRPAPRVKRPKLLVLFLVSLSNVLMLFEAFSVDDVKPSTAVPSKDSAMLSDTSPITLSSPSACCEMLFKLATNSESSAVILTTIFSSAILFF